MGKNTALILMVFTGIVGLGFGDEAPAPCLQIEKPPEYITVGEYGGGTANERIDAAITAALETEHKTVFFPDGNYLLRHTVNLNRGARTELHLVGESRDGVRLVPDIAYLEAHFNDGNFREGNGRRLAHMINLSGPAVFDFVDVSIQNMTLDMKCQSVHYQPITYNVVGHGIRVGTGWRKGQFKVNHVTIKNIGGYGIGIQDRGGFPKNNITLTNLHIERIGSDGIDTKEASGDGNRNLVIRDVTVKDIGYTDGGFAAALDIRYRNVIIERVKLMSAARVVTPSGKTTNNGGLNFRPEGAVLEAHVSDVYIKGFGTAINLHAAREHEHKNVHISKFRIHDYANSGINIMGAGHSGHKISDGYVYSDRGKALVYPERGATVFNVTEAPWPAVPPEPVSDQVPPEAPHTDGVVPLDKDTSL